MYGDSDDYVHDDEPSYEKVETLEIPKHYAESSVSKTAEVMRVIRFLSYFPGDDIEGLKRKLALERKLVKVEKAIKEFYEFERDETVR